MQGNQSYTNLAALASGFESTHQRHAGPANGMVPSGSPEVLQARAMELVQTGLQIDLHDRNQAVEHYQRGADILSRALEDAPPEPLAGQMQRTLDMVTERVRSITRKALSRSASELAMDIGVGARPSDELKAAALEGKACNYWDLNARPELLPPELRAARSVFGTLFEDLMRRFGFQADSVRCQQEHLGESAAD